jgi:hypothetical protein
MLELVDGAGAGSRVEFPSRGLEYRSLQLVDVLQRQTALVARTVGNVTQQTAFNANTQEQLAERENQIAIIEDDLRKQRAEWHNELLQLNAARDALDARREKNEEELFELQKQILAANGAEKERLAKKEQELTQLRTELLQESRKTRQQSEERQQKSIKEINVLQKQLLAQSTALAEAAQALKSSQSDHQAQTQEDHASLQQQQQILLSQQKQVFEKQAQTNKQVLEQLKRDQQLALDKLVESQRTMMAQMASAHPPQPPAAPGMPAPTEMDRILPLLMTLAAKVDSLQARVDNRNAPAGTTQPAQSAPSGDMASFVAAIRGDTDEGYATDPNNEESCKKSLAFWTTTDRRLESTEQATSHMLSTELSRTTFEAEWRRRLRPRPSGPEYHYQLVEDMLVRLLSAFDCAAIHFADSPIAEYNVRKALRLALEAATRLRLTLQGVDSKAFPAFTEALRKARMKNRSKKAAIEGLDCTFTLIAAKHAQTHTQKKEWGARGSKQGRGPQRGPGREANPRQRDQGSRDSSRSRSAGRQREKDRKGGKKTDDSEESSD